MDVEYTCIYMYAKGSDKRFNPIRPGGGGGVAFDACANFD